MRLPVTVHLLSGCICDTPDICMQIKNISGAITSHNTWSREAVNTLARGAGPYPQWRAVTASEWSEKVNLSKNKYEFFTLLLQL